MIITIKHFTLRLPPRRNFGAPDVTRPSRKTSRRRSFRTAVIVKPTLGGRSFAETGGAVSLPVGTTQGHVADGASTPAA